jgi:hypothetical protein
MIRTQYYHYSWREHVTTTEIHKVNLTLTKFPSVLRGRGHSIPQIASTSRHGLHFLCNGNANETPVKRLAQKRKTQKHDEQPRTKAAGAELVGTGGGRPRRRLWAEQHWCRARVRAAADLLGRHGQPRTMAAAAELAGTPAADLGDERAMLGRSRRRNCSVGASNHTPRRRPWTVPTLMTNSNPN